MDSRPNLQTKGVDQPGREYLAESISISELLEQLTGFLRRQFPIFIFLCACAVGIGLVYLLTTPARYTSHAMLLIDSSKMRVLQQQQSALGDVPLDTAQVETQVEVLKSENIGLSVIKDMRLNDDPEFVGSGGGFVAAVFGFISGLFESDTGASSAATSELQLSRRALGAFLRQRTINRVGRTYVLDITFTSLSPGRAAAVANGIAEAYIVDQLEAKYQATRRASAWLQERIAELRTQASAADRAVLEYKEKNKIVDVGGTTPAGGTGPRLLGEQQLAELSSQLSAARATVAEAKARLERIDQVRSQDVPDAAVADSLHSEIIIRLRNQYLDMSAREAIWSARYGQSHLAAVNLRTQMDQLRRSIADELRRIAESQKSDYEIAKSRVEGLERDLSGLVSESQVTNRDRLGLRELESNAQVYHTIYDNFLQRYMEAIQQQSFPITEARVISTAAPPTAKSSPRTFAVLAIALAIGLILSFVAAVLREAIDRVFRSSRQVEEMLHTNCLAILPLLTNAGSSSGPETAGDITRPRQTALAGIKRAGKTDKFYRQVVLEPLSSFAESFRAIKVAADIGAVIKDNKVIGVTSTMPKEGKSTVSSNLGELIAHAGKKVILVDGDLRNPSITRGRAPDAAIGLLEVLSGKVELHDAVIIDEVTGLVFLPAVIESRLAHTNEILASEAFKQLIAGLRKTYDYIIIDFPALAPVVDVRTTTNFVDSYVYVVEWGRTRMNVVQHQLASAPEIYDRLLGVVLNKANVKVLERYEYYYGRYYHRKYYAQYGYAE